MMLGQGTYKRGMTIVEVMIGSALLLTTVGFVMSAINLYLADGAMVRARAEETTLSVEGQEMVRYIRDNNWDTISSLIEGTTYYLDVATTTIALTTTPQTVNNVYTRTVIFSPVQRDSNDNIVTSGGTTDNGSRYVAVVVTNGSTTATTTALITDLFNN